MTLEFAIELAQKKLALNYEPREADNVINWLLEELTGKTKMERILSKTAHMPPESILQFHQQIEELANNKPIQYILGKAWFWKMEFLVSPQVLIPRPETEELIEWMLIDKASTNPSWKNCLDIGTGSGCLAISIKKEFPEMDITGIDISQGALEIAKSNAKKLNQAIHLKNLDFLNEQNWKELGIFDCIVSNPPYIQEKEGLQMHDRVTQHEPSTALFVPDHDPMIFYHQIAKFAKSHLAPKGSIYVEINEALSELTIQAFEKYDFHTCLKKDYQGKDRMLKMNWPV